MHLQLSKLYEKQRKYILKTHHFLIILQCFTIICAMGAIFLHHMNVLEIIYDGVWPHTFQEVSAYKHCKSGLTPHNQSLNIPISQMKKLGFGE